VSTRIPDPVESTRQYRRGAVMGLTVAEAFMLLAFVLLMLMMLWRSEDARKLAAAKGFTDLPADEREAVIETARKLQASGLDPTDPIVQAKLTRILALGDATLPQDILQRIAQASDDERRKLEDLIRTDAWRGQPEDTVAERVAGRLEAAAASRAEVTRVLRQSLGPVVESYGGTIDDDGALVFPESVLFEAGKSDITPELRRFLAAVCLPWFRTLERSGAPISDLRIEGHASSEWIGASPEQAYLANLSLSQARAHAVLSTCLELVPGPEGSWARERATAIGYSSSHPVISDGQEDKAKSRRVVFRVDYDLENVIDAIKKDVQTGDRLGDDLDDGKGEIFETGATATGGASTPQVGR